MRVALDLVAVHIGAGIALIGIADDVLDIRLGLGQKVPFVAREKAGSAASAQPGCLNLFNNAFLAPVDQHFVERLVAADSNIFFDVRRIDQSAIPQDDLLLPLEEGDRVPRRNIRITLAVSHVPGNVIPFLDLAVNKVRRHGLRGKALQNTRGIVGLDMPQHQERVSRKPDAHQRLLKAGAKAPNAGEQHIHPAALDRLIQGVIELFGAIAAATRSHPHCNARNGRQQLGKSGFTYRVERTNIQNARHYFLPCVNAFTSRCNVRSFTRLRMWWFTSTTGASAHWPKQATVRIVNL